MEELPRANSTRHSSQPDPGAPLPSPPPPLRLIYDRRRSDVTLLAVVVVAVASSFVVVAFPPPKVEIALEAVTVVTASEKSFWQINRGEGGNGMHAAAAARD